MRKQLLCPRLCLAHQSLESPLRWPADPPGLAVRPRLSPNASSPSGALPAGARTPASCLGRRSPDDGAPSRQQQLVQSSPGRGLGFSRIINYHSQEQNVFLSRSRPTGLSVPVSYCSSYPMDMECFFRRDTCTGSVAHYFFCRH